MAHGLDIVVPLQRFRKHTELLCKLVIEFRLHGRIRQIIPGSDDLGLIHEGIFSLPYQLLIGLWTLGLYKFIGVLIALHLQYAHIEACIPEYGEGPQLGLDACLVAVLGKDDLIRISLEQPCMLLIESRAQRGHCIGEARLMEGDHIHIALT